jgi:purine-nucleoside phosphorylase
MIDIPRSPFDLAEEAAERIRELSPARPRIAVVLGSGLGAALQIPDAVEIPYGAIPHFPISTVPGHAGALYLGNFGGIACAFLSGRAHLYEGYDPLQVTFSTRVMSALGATTVILTNAAGGINPTFEVGNLMLIKDHINLTGRNPLVGPNDDRLGPRFPDMSDAYSPKLREIAARVAAERNQKLVEGVYCGLLGPSYETPAEIRMLRALGADAVGMSTVLEAIAARHAGMEVLGIACITNMAAGMLPQKLMHEDVVETTARVREQFAQLVARIVSRIGEQETA